MARGFISAKIQFTNEPIDAQVMKGFLPRPEELALYGKKRNFTRTPFTHVLWPFFKKVLDVVLVMKCNWFVFLKDSSCGIKKGIACNDAF
jgi:hypothetical protein